ncbi:DUF4246 domain-containing protein [Aspergillus thermomutatus]|uniref:Uncharacterized protein n=1 Tax=Aspergillus thermomutatus TaxID=41047 RepID=A0A397GBW7_ASPTH|nr:uncharacterized protein CDV56_101554 [Aspergillus thermomutatus]RHZ45580.1 hypothetical protein CDV56_101554 [Aspergillus thermomutatus]
MQFSNTGQGPLQVPGFNGIPLDYQLPREDRFAHGFVEFRHTPRLTAREVAMLRVMEAVTEEARWDEAVLQPDESRLAQWHENAQKTEGFLISPAAWDWCIAELRDKAMAWRTSGRMLLLNTSSAVCVAEDVTLASSFQRLIARLAPGQTSRAKPSPESPDYLHLVDPFLYPLVYGQTWLLVSGGHVPVTISCQEAPVPAHPVDQMRRRLRINPRTGHPNWSRRSGAVESCWSNHFQRLPCEVKFSSDGTKDVCITSYINNLHPQHHRDLYALLEKLIAQAIPTWNDVLFKGTHGRTPPRILTYGFETHNGEYPPWFDRVKTPNTMYRHYKVAHTEEQWQEVCDLVRPYLALPEPPVWKQAYPRRPDEPEDWLAVMTPDNPTDAKVWKAGKYTGRAIIPQARGRFPDPEHHGSASINLAEQFQEDGLQVVVQVSRIDLTPDNPTYAGESMFRVEGLLNEHVAANTVYCVDEENVTEAQFTFQHEDKIHSHEYDHSNSHVMSSILDLPDWDYLEDPLLPAVHTLGSVPARRGRLLSWPNTLRSKADSFTLQDPRRAGHRTLIKLWLVDPHYRICSTRNVPPQQHDWWAEAARKAAGLDARLPAELVLLIIDQTESWPMSMADALDLREEFRQEQARTYQAVHDAAGHHVVGDLDAIRDFIAHGESP